MISEKIKDSRIISTIKHILNKPMFLWLEFVIADYQQIQSPTSLPQTRKWFYFNSKKSIIFLS